MIQESLIEDLKSVSEVGVITNDCHYFKVRKLELIKNMKDSDEPIRYTITTDIYKVVRKVMIIR